MSTFDWFVTSILGDLPDDPNPAPLSDPVGEYLAALRVGPRVPDETIAKSQAERGFQKLRGDITNLPREATNPFKPGRCEPDLQAAFTAQTLYKLGADVEAASWVPADPRLRHPNQEPHIPTEPTPLHPICAECGCPFKLCECEGGPRSMPGGGADASKVIAFRSLAPSEPAALLLKRERENVELASDSDFESGPGRFDGYFVEDWRR